MPITSQDPEEIVTGVGGMAVDPGAMDSPEWRPPGSETAWRDPTPRRVSPKPFATKPGYAVAVRQRAPAAVDTVYYTVQSTLTPIQVCRRLIGRVSASVWVPAAVAGSAPNGVLISEDDSGLWATAQTATLPGGGKFNILNAGDSLEHASEAPLWAFVIPGNTTGVVQVMDRYDPAIVTPGQEG
jgi:hypothetical protein